MKKKKTIRRFKYQLWQTFLKATIICAALNVIVFGCCLDSSSMVWANLPREEEKGDEEEWI